LAEIFVEVRKLRLFASIGLWDHERTAPQPIEIDITARLETPPASDRLSETACYDDLADIAKAAAAEGHHDLIETLALKIAQRVKALPNVAGAEARVAKTPQTLNAESTAARAVV